MSNLAQAVNRQITVPFHGAELYVIEHESQPYAPMRVIVEGMGLAWQPQHRKLTETRFNATITELVTVAQDGKQRKAICLPLRKLPGWLMSIEPGKVKDLAVRERVIQYQNECDDVLWQYWNEGIALNPRTGFSVNPDDILTGDQQETLRLMVKTLAERLPKPEQGPATIKVWSKLKAHFKVSYRQIPQVEFSEAVSIVTRTAAEWVVVDDTPPLPPPANDPTVALEQALNSGRWLMSTHEGRVSLKPVRDDCYVITAEQFAMILREPGGVSPGLLPDIIAACAERLSRKAA